MNKLKSMLNLNLKTQQQQAQILYLLLFNKSFGFNKEKWDQSYSDLFMSQEHKQTSHRSSDYHPAPDGTQSRFMILLRLISLSVCVCVCAIMMSWLSSSEVEVCVYKIGWHHRLCVWGWSLQQTQRLKTKYEREKDKAGLWRPGPAGSDDCN